MIDLFYAIKQRLSSIEGISLIDENWGQLTNWEEGYPVTYPAILIDAPTVEWTSSTREEQRGEATVTVALVIDCYHDTHYGSTQEQEASEHIQLMDSVNALLHGWSAGTGCGMLCRKQTRIYSDEHAVRVYENTYECKIVDAIPIEVEGTMSVNTVVQDKG